jgi:hypothetical protein
VGQDPRVLRRLVIGALLLLAAGMVWLSASFKGEPEDPALVDSAVVALQPPKDAPAVVPQADVAIVLAPGWDGDLVVNGVIIPEDEERQNGPANEVAFTPGPGKVLRSLPPGLLRVTAVIWRPAEGQSRDRGSRQVTWSFRVA